MYVRLLSLQSDLIHDFITASWRQAVNLPLFLAHRTNGGAYGTKLCLSSATYALWLSGTSDRNTV